MGHTLTGSGPNGVAKSSWKLAVSALFCLWNYRHTGLKLIRRPARPQTGGIAPRRPSTHRCRAGAKDLLRRCVRHRRRPSPVHRTLRHKNVPAGVSRRFRVISRFALIDQSGKSGPNRCCQRRKDGQAVGQIPLLPVELRGLRTLTPHCQEQAQALNRRFGVFWPVIWRCRGGNCRPGVLVKIVVGQTWNHRRAAPSTGSPQKGTHPPRSPPQHEVLMIYKQWAMMVGICRGDCLFVGMHHVLFEPRNWTLASTRSSPNRRTSQTTAFTPL